MSALHHLAWPPERLGDAIAALAREGGLEPAAVQLPEPPPFDSSTARAAWVEAAARCLEIESERVPISYPQVREWLGQAHLVLALIPALGYLAQLRPGVLIGPDLRRHRVAPEQVRNALCREMDEAARAALAPAMERAGLSPRERSRAERALVDVQLTDRWLSPWTFHVPVTAPWHKLFRQGPWASTVVRLGALHLLRLATFLLAWQVIGSAVLTGRLERGWLLAWALLLLTVAPLHMAGQWIQVRFAIALGALLKQRLLAGALRLDPERVLSIGAGQLLAKTYESSAVENLALAGGFTGLIACMELCSAVGVFVAGGMPVAAGILMAWLVATAVFARLYLTRARHWTEQRMDLTNSLVERMVGHRTRLAQERSENWHEAEDQELSHYLTASRGRDSAEAMLDVVVPGGWLLVGVASLAPAFLSDQPAQAPLAAGLGGVLLASGAFRKLTAAAWQLIDAWIAREQIRELAASAERREPTGSPTHAAAARGGAAVEAKDLIFRYQGAEEPVLRRCSVRLEPGARVVLEGASGGGKSTLAAVLAGLRAPQSGLLMAGGLDRATIGADGWRHRVALAPQFHQNHMITGPLSFNLLMSRPEPHVGSDLREAEEVCRELGLGPLLERMPGGMAQSVGETGWQMSQGERSRVFLARALLQRADLVILDESFGALDPETRKQAVDCAIRRAKSLLVIAHR